MGQRAPAGGGLGGQRGSLGKGPGGYRTGFGGRRRLAGRCGIGRIRNRSLRVGGSGRIPRVRAAGAGSSKGYGLQTAGAAGSYCAAIDTHIIRGPYAEGKAIHSGILGQRGGNGRRGRAAGNAVCGQGHPGAAIGGVFHDPVGRPGVGAAGLKAELEVFPSGAG